MSNEGVHFNKRMDTELKKRMQKAFEFKYPELDFLKEFGKSYL